MSRLAASPSPAFIDYRSVEDTESSQLLSQNYVPKSFIDYRSVEDTERIVRASYPKRSHIPSLIIRSVEDTESRLVLTSASYYAILH